MSQAWTPREWPTEAAARAAVVAEARTWLGTPYAHRQRLKGFGADCVGLPAEVYAAVGLIPPVDTGAYSAQWHLHRSRELYLEGVGRFAREIDPAAIQAGDFMVFRHGRTFSHGVIVVDPPLVIHAYAPARRVTLDDLTVDEMLRGRPARAFTFWGR